MLNGKILASVSLYFFNPHHNFRNLLFQNGSLSFGTHRDFLKLRMSDNHSIILTRCNSAAELFSVCRFKILFCGNQNICGRIKLQKLACPLFSQVVRHNKHSLLAQPKAFAFHCGGCHFKGFACPNAMCKQRISAVQNMCDSVYLMLPQCNFGIHAVKNNVTAIIFSWSVGIEQNIVSAANILTPLMVFPYPLCKSILDCLLLALCNGSFLFI